MVRGRIPDVQIDAVEYAAELVGMGAQHPVEAVAETGGLNLLGVGGADGGDPVGEHDTALEHGKVAEELQGFGGPPFGGQVQAAEFLVGKHAAVGQVVDRVHAGRGVRRQLEQGGQQAGLPVMGVHHVGFPVQNLTADCQLGHGPGEHRETVGIVMPVVTVGMQVGAAGAVEQVRGVHQQQGHAQVMIPGFQDAHVMNAAGALHTQPAGNAHFADLFQYQAVGGQNHAHVLALFLQGPGQGVDHVAQAAGLYQGIGFACGKQNLHG